MKVSFYTLDNRLRIRFSYQGTRYHFALGLDDNELGRLKAREISSQIEKDCLFDNFDSTLECYKFNLKPVEKKLRKSGKDYPFNPKRMPFTTNQVKSLLTALEDSHYHDFYHFSFLSGLRMSELIGLTFNRVGDTTITVDRALARSKTGNSCGKSRYFKETKNHQKREILITPKMREIISRQSGNGDQLIFRSPKGLPVNDRTLLSRVFYPLQNDLGITPLRCHYAIRHTVATKMLESGVSANHCAFWLGHSVEVFLSSYVYAQLPKEFSDLF
ncbi:tyrosine-type recombinase/integrase [Nodosilinea sp. LEGE 06152]|uniref:tyrosine-type recombinase/integrase n=1 Tax=Nodosilinea sp. LEGE 06152 TaxID=2777966 RepID=UPI00187FD2EF|nr:tyrosine-type recombinase/integrase [Nodosilinea sp. LEGE 06152]MBE9156497.1 tyrosine-type recombinase/integrase [Nodosilinea sp. LEGE 06152]